IQSRSPFKSIREFEREINWKNGSVNQITDSPTIDKLNEIKIKLPELNIDWLLSGKGEMMELRSNPPTLNTVQEIKEIYQPEPQKFSEKTYKKEVTVIPAKAQLGLQSFLYPEEMMQELE